MSARTIGEDLRAQAARDPAREAVVAGERRLSYGELDRAADALADDLRRRGVGRGDRVAFVMHNSAELAIGLYGALRAGAAISPLNPTIKAQKLAYVLADSGAAAVVCDDELRGVVSAARDGLAAPPVVVERSEIDALAGEGGAAGRAPLEGDLAAVIYTSGSTGDPKGVTLTHRNMTFAADSIIEYLELGPDDRVLCVLPLSFDYGLYQLLMSVRVGATLVLERGFALVGRVVALLEQERITGLPGVPTVFGVLTSMTGLAERELPHLRFLTNTGAALSTAAVDAIRRTFPRARLYSMYGLTECKRVSWLPPEQLDIRPTSVGLPIPGTEVWIEDERGRRVAPGEVGELMVRGAHVMQGYWNAPEATAERLRPGRWPWERVLATGDLFRQDEEGYLYFVGRRDDLIKSRGEKVVPRELEEVLHQAPGVREAAVVGVPDRLLGQAVHAYVSLEPGAQVDEAALRRHCAERLEDYKIPRRVIVCAELPKTPNGKIDRLALRESAAAEAEERVEAGRAG